MRKPWLLFLLPLFIQPAHIISTEKVSKSTLLEQYQFSPQNYGLYYKDILKNPAVYQDLLVYQDRELTKPAGLIKKDQVFKTQSFDVNNAGVPVFELSNHTFVQADSNLIYDDQVYSVKKMEARFWTKPGFTMYESPYVIGVKTKKSSIDAYKEVFIEEIADTANGTYAKIKGDGWILLDFLSDQDTRIDQVQQLLNEKYNLPNVSIYVKQLDTGQTAGIQEDKKMYAASVLKLAFLYASQEGIHQGHVKENQSLKYIKEVNDAVGAYDPEGSGSLPKEADNKEYTLSDVINRVAKESDNVGSNLLNYYIAKQSDKDFQANLMKLAGEKWDVEERDASSKMAGQLMEAIYRQNGRVIDSLSQTNFDDQRISKNIPDKVAHKIGDADDFRHDVAIVYAKTPFILSIFTEHASYEDITAIADLVYGVYK